MNSLPEKSVKFVHSRIAELGTCYQHNTQPLIALILVSLTPSPSRSRSPSLSLSFSILTAISGEPGLASFIRAKDDGGGGDNWSYKTCKVPVKLKTHLFWQPYKDIIL